NRFLMVPLLSSAARMPLPGATSALAVARSSSVMEAPPREPDAAQSLAPGGGQAAVGRVAQPAALPAEEGDLDGHLGADEHRGRVVRPGPAPAAAEQDRRGLGEPALVDDQGGPHPPHPPPGPP